MGIGFGRRGLGALGLGALAGCALRPDPLQPGAEVPDAFREYRGERLAWPDPSWWRGFGAAELDALMERASVRNLELAAATARVRAADAAARVAGAALLPSVGVGASATRNRAGRLSPTERYDVTLSADYEVDLWGRIANDVLSARLSARARRFGVVTVELTTQASVANTYFAIRQGREELRVQEQNLAAARRVLGVIRAQVTGGVATGLDVAQQETVVAQQEAAIPPLRQGIAANEAALATLVGTSLPSLGIRTDGLRGLTVPAVGSGVPTELLQRRPDVLSAEADLASANANVAVARAALFPSLTLSSSGGIASDVIGTILRPEARVASITASLFQTVFDGGARRAAIEIRRAEADELLANYRLTILTALSDTETAINALRETTEQERLLREAATRAERASAIAEAQLAGGTVTLIVLLNAQAQVFSARRNLTRGQLQRLQAAVGLFRNLGGGWGARESLAVTGGAGDTVGAAASGAARALERGLAGPGAAGPGSVEPAPAGVRR